MNSRFAKLALVLVMFATGKLALAQDEPIAWSSLSEAQQQVLRPYVEEWDYLGPERQVRLAEGARRFAGMSDEERDAAKQRFQNWNSLSNEQRATIRDRYQAFQRLSPDEQARVRDNYRRFREMSPERRQQLRERYRQMTPEQRDRVRDRLRNRPQRTRPNDRS